MDSPIYFYQEKKKTQQHIHWRHKTFLHGVADPTPTFNFQANSDLSSFYKVKTKIISKILIFLVICWKAEK